MVRTYPRLRKDEETFVSNTVRNPGNILFSSIVRRCNITDSVVYNFVFKAFYLLFYCFLAGQGNGYLINRIYASGWFVRY